MYGKLFVADTIPSCGCQNLHNPESDHWFGASAIILLWDLNFVTCTYKWPWAIKDTTSGHSTTFSEGQWFHVHFFACKIGKCDQWHLDPQTRRSKQSWPCFWLQRLGLPKSYTIPCRSSAAILWPILAYLPQECSVTGYNKHAHVQVLLTPIHIHLPLMGSSIVMGDPRNGWFGMAIPKIKWIITRGTSTSGNLPLQGCEDHPLISYPSRWQYLALLVGRFQSGLSISWA